MLKTLTIEKSLLPLLLITMLTGCGSSGSDSASNTPSPDPTPAIVTEQQALTDAQNLWNSHASEYYTYQYQRSCECLPDATALMDLSVINNTLLSARNHTTGEIVPAQIRDHINTVAEIFAVIQSAIDTDAASITVNYHLGLGYPELVNIDYDAVMADDEFLLIVSDLAFANPIEALDDVQWQLEYFVTFLGLTPPVADSSISLTFTSESLIYNGNGGCNNYYGDYVLGDSQDTVLVTTIGSTEMACSLPEGVLAQETRYFNTLIGVTEFFFDDNQLQLVNGPDNVLQYVRAE
ncbi:MAG: META domain-containing protein [Algicola sp.]|nr:META domain-containing protein [Algicola sp.]